MKVRETDIAGVWVVETDLREDKRGSFFRAFCDFELAEILDGRVIRQVNVSCTKSVGAIRGMHFQYPPESEMKCVRCLAGAVWDVVVDLRKGSATFLKCFGVRLSADAANMIVIPEGCAHGFQVLEPVSQLLYMHTVPYVPECECGVRYDDPRIGIDWPLPVAEVSDRDMGHPLLASFEGIVI